MFAFVGAPWPMGHQRQPLSFSLRRNADTAQLTDGINTLPDEIAAVNAQQAQAIEIRNADKAKNEEAIADPKVGQGAVEKAMKVIQGFCEKRADGSDLEGGRRPDGRPH